MRKQIGILTSGGDCPGLNAAIRGVVQDRTMPLERDALSNILTQADTVNKLVEAKQDAGSKSEKREAAVALERVAGKKKLVPLDHPWLESARRVGTCLGD